MMRDKEVVRKREICIRACKEKKKKFAKWKEVPRDKRNNKFAQHTQNISEIDCKINRDKKIGQRQRNEKQQKKKQKNKAEASSNGK